MSSLFEPPLTDNVRSGLTGLHILQVIRSLVYLNDKSLTFQNS